METQVHPLMILLLIVVVFGITFWKKQRQLGKTWRGESATVTLGGKKLSCLYCGHDRFFKREGLLTTTWLMFWRLAFWNRSVPTFVCERCGFAHSFLAHETSAEFHLEEK